MLTEKTAKDIMVDISKYPHISCESSLKQAIKVFRDSVLEGDRCIKPIIALVLDDKKLVGTLRLRDVLKGLEPGFMKPVSNMQGFHGGRDELAIIWETLFNDESEVLIERPVKETMSPIAEFVGPDDPILKAAYLLINNDLLVLPVLENKKKLLGLVRMIEVFDTVAATVLKSTKNNIIPMRARA